VISGLGQVRVFKAGENLAYHSNRKQRLGSHGRSWAPWMAVVHATLSGSP